MKKKRDILFLCQFFYPEYISSAQLPYDTVLALRDAGFSVGALCGYPREYAEGGKVPTKEDADGIHIHRLKYIQTGRAGFLGRIVNYFSFTFHVLLHLPEIGKYRAVVVYSNPPILPWIASWAKSLFGTKLVFVSYDLYPEVATVTNTLREGSVICRLMNHINKCVFRRADRVVALSSEQKNCILRTRNAVDELVTVIPNWYRDEGGLRDREENRFRELTAGRFVVSYFGNMGTMQDMETILGAIRALREEKDVFFLFAGHGNKMEKLREIIAQESIENVRIPSWSGLSGRAGGERLRTDFSGKGCDGALRPQQDLQLYDAGHPPARHHGRVRHRPGYPVRRGALGAQRRKRAISQGHPFPAGQPGESPGHAQKMPGAVSAKVHHRNLHGKICISFPGTFTPGNRGGE